MSALLIAVFAANGFTFAGRRDTRSRRRIKRLSTTSILSTAIVDIALTGFVLMAANWIGYLFDETTLAGGDLIVALAIADHANPAGVAWPGRKLLAKKTRLSERQVSRILKRLEAGGYLSIGFTPGRGHVPVYQLLKKATPATPIKPEKGDADDAFSADKTGHLKRVKRDICDTKTGHLTQKNGLHIRNEPLEPSYLNQLIDEVAEENPDVDRRVVAAGVFRTLGRVKELDLGPIKTRSYFVPEIRTVQSDIEQAAAKGYPFTSERLDNFVEYCRLRYHSTINA